MKRIITEHPAARRFAGRRFAGRLAWFVGLWLASVTCLSGIAYLLHKIILG